MKPADWKLIWKTIRAHEQVWASVGAKTSDPAAKEVLRQFFKFWDPVYMLAMEIEDQMNRGVYVKPTEFRSIAQGLWNARERAMRIGLGLDRQTGTFYPKITDPKTLALIKAEIAPRSTPRITPRIPFTSAGEDMTTIPESFRSQLTGEISADHILTLRVCWGGRCYSAQVDIKPIAERIRTMIRQYHVNVLHGDTSAETVAGIGDWFKTSVRTATRIANAKAAKKLWKTVEKHHGKIEAGLSMLGPYGQAAAVGMRTGFTVKSMLAKAKAGDPVAIQDIRSIGSLAKEGDPSAEQVMKMMKAMNEMAKAREAKVEESVNGWLWNRPYREDAPSLRNLYHLGMMV